MSLPLCSQCRGLEPEDDEDDVDGDDDDVDEDEDGDDVGDDELMRECSLIWHLHRVCLSFHSSKLLSQILPPMKRGS